MLVNPITLNLSQAAEVGSVPRALFTHMDGHLYNTFGSSQRACAPWPLGMSDVALLEMSSILGHLHRMHHPFSVFTWTAPG